LEELGEAPDPEAWRGDYPGYARLCNTWTEIVRAEAALREFAYAREHGRADVVASRRGRPLIDAEHRLVSRDRNDDAKRGRRRGRPSAATWVPPATPKWLRSE